MSPVTYELSKSDLTVSEFLDNNIFSGYRGLIKIRIAPKGKSIEGTTNESFSYGTLHISYRDNWKEPTFIFSSNCEKQDFNKMYEVVLRAVDGVLRGLRPYFKDIPDVSEVKLGEEEYARGFDDTELLKEAGILPAITVGDGVIAEIASRIKQYGCDIVIDATYDEVPQNLAEKSGFQEPVSLKDDEGQKYLVSCGKIVPAPTSN